MWELRGSPALSQITIPWTPRTPEVLDAYRTRAIRGLFGLGVVLVLVGIVVFSAFGIHAQEQIQDWRIAVAWLGVLGPLGAGGALIAGAIGIIFWRQIGAILAFSYVAVVVFCGAIVVVGLGAWAVSWLFGVVERIIASGGGGYVTAQAFYDGIDGPCQMPITAYVLWPLQCEIVRDLIAVAGIVGFVCTFAAFGIWWERKVAGRIQSRLGPMRVGLWHGWAQSPADGIKLVLKEDTVPPGGDGFLFRLAPYLAFIPVICAFVALPFAATWVFRDLDVALIFILAMIGLDVIGTIIAGWASNNKWSVYGAMREACQMVSYEIPMGMSLLIPVMLVGSMNLTTIAGAQSGGFWTWLIFSNPWCFVAFFTYYIAALASCKRAPFDLPEAESELVAGFLTEYSGFRWALFFFGEYAAMFGISGLVVILFLGGWHSPLPASWAPEWAGAWYTQIASGLIRGVMFDGPVIFILKAAAMFYTQLWIRWTLPRIRIDQVLYACIQVMLPLVMVLLLGNTLWMLLVEHYEIGFFVVLDGLAHWVLVAIGVLVAAFVLGLAAYGFINKRRMVGYLAIDHLPGA